MPQNFDDMKNLIVENVLQRTPISLIVLCVLDYILLGNLGKIYISQMENDIPEQSYVLISIFILLTVNIIVILAYSLSNVFSNSIKKALKEYSNESKSA